MIEGWYGIEGEVTVGRKGRNKGKTIGKVTRAVYPSTWKTLATIYLYLCFSPLAGSSLRAGTISYLYLQSLHLV